MKSVQENFLRTRIARLSWVNSSRTFSVRCVPAIIGSAVNDVVRPDVVALPGPKLDARSIAEPSLSFPHLCCRHFQPLPPPSIYMSTLRRVYRYPQLPGQRELLHHAWGLNCLCRLFATYDPPFS